MNSDVVIIKKYVDYLLNDQYDGHREYEGLCELIWHHLNIAEKEVLRQLLFTGPVWDGNIISKSTRDDLLDFKLATRCCYMGEQGYTAATYLAYSVFKYGGGTPIPARPATQG